MRGTWFSSNSECNGSIKFNMEKEIIEKMMEMYCCTEQPAYSILHWRSVQMSNIQMREKKWDFFLCFPLRFGQNWNEKKHFLRIYLIRNETKHWTTCILVVCKWNRKSSIETFILGPIYIWMYKYIHISIYTTHSIDSQAKMYSSHIRAQWRKKSFIEILQICSTAERKRAEKKRWMETLDK